MSIRTTIFPAIFILAIVWSCTSSGKKVKEIRGPKDTPPLSITGLILKPEEVDNKIEIIGTILSNEKVDLRSEVSGRVTGIHFKEDAKVSKGTLLVKIFDEELRAQYKKIKLQQELANREEDRKRKLLEIGGISQEEYDIASNQASTLNADLDLLSAQLRKTEVKAPFSGIIGLRYVSEGEIVSPTTVIASLQQIDPIKLEFDIPEKYGAFVKKGSDIKFTVTGSDKIYQGTVYASEPMVDVATRTLKVRARSSNEDFSLRPGSFIKIDLLLQKDAQAIMAPTQSIVPMQNGSKVFVYKQGYAISKNVKTGVRNDSAIQITDGLNAGDTLITSGIMQLKDSLKVNITLSK
ncbi:efflux RND transporter periplasmic adaptor subunit [Sporocytophaga myxococcoides]|uniref:efflux RND transporter periplasmic adaptor subunit n=1 Tax=Sporocytophaga myxococcoides TaxID=153721 RepID=UPI0003FA8614|nr:efflux RND transporter periplasmic adaptor subunit [Sporocytophaga myxococcoides]